MTHLNLKCESFYAHERTHTHSNHNWCYCQQEHKVTEPEMMSTIPCVSFPLSVIIGSQIRIVTDYISDIPLIQVFCLIFQLARLFFAQIKPDRLLFVRKKKLRLCSLPAIKVRTFVLDLLDSRGYEEVKAYTHTAHSHTPGKFPVQTLSTFIGQQNISDITWRTEALLPNAIYTLP